MPIPLQPQAIGQSLTSKLGAQDRWLVPALQHCAHETELTVLIKQREKTCEPAASAQQNPAAFADWVRRDQPWRSAEHVEALKQRLRFCFSSPQGQALDDCLPPAGSLRLDNKL